MANEYGSKTELKPEDIKTLTKTFASSALKMVDAKTREEYVSASAAAITALVTLHGVGIKSHTVDVFMELACESARHAKSSGALSVVVDTAVRGAINDGTLLSGDSGLNLPRSDYRF